MLEDVVNLTTGDELELEKIGEEKTALFGPYAGNDDSFHFLASALITQLFQLMMAQADARSTGSLPVPVHFVLEEARNITLPDSFQNWVATMRSRKAPHIIDYSAKYIADQAYVPGRLGVRVRHVR